MHVAMRCAMLEGGRAWNRGNAFANQKSLSRRVAVIVRRSN